MLGENCFASNLMCCWVCFNCDNFLVSLPYTFKFSSEARSKELKCQTLTARKSLFKKH